jgi:hypothetical protein
MTKRRASFPRFRRDGHVPRMELTDNDASILKHVYRHRFIAADDLYRLFPERSPDGISRRLTKLFRNEYLDRPMAQIDRYRGGGSSPYVYGLGNLGARYLKTLGSPVGATDWRSRNRTYTRENLDHTLAVSRYLIDLELACRQRGDLSVLHFEQILGAAPPSTRNRALPGCWSVPVQFGGSKSSVTVSPDSIIGLRQTPVGGPSRVAYIFLEVDRGTMTIVPAEHVRDSESFLYRATILRKLLTYAESWKQELHKTHFGISAPRVLTLTTTKARAKAMQSAATEHVVRRYRLSPGIFLFGVQNEDRGSFNDEITDSAGRSVHLLPPGAPSTDNA